MLLQLQQELKRDRQTTHLLQQTEVLTLQLLHQHARANPLLRQSLLKDHQVEARQKPLQEQNQGLIQAVQTQEVVMSQVQVAAIQQVEDQEEGK